MALSVCIAGDTDVGMRVGSGRSILSSLPCGLWPTWLFPTTVVFYCSVTIVPRTEQLRTIHTYYLTVSAGRESGHNLAGSSAQDLKAAIQVPRGTCRYLGAWMGKTASRLTPVAGRIYFFEIKDRGPWLRAGRRLPSAPRVA